MKKTIGLVALLLATSSTYANAEQNFGEDLTPKYKGFYIGAGLGTTSFESESDSSTSMLEEDGSTIKLLAGYQFNKVFALEGQYTQYSDLTFDVYTMSPSSLSLSANVGYSLPNGLRPFGVIGFSSLDLDESFTVFEDEVSSAIRYGFGLEFTPPQLEGFSLRVGYEVDLFAIDFVDSGSTTTHDYTLEAFYVSAAYKF